MKAIPSNYNFVPPPDKVFCPDPDGDETHEYHDIPFRDGLSGALKAEFTATTPVFVRGSGRHPRHPGEKQRSLAHQTHYRLPSGQYALPSTTVSGMLRSVFQIVTFSKLSPSGNNPRLDLTQIVFGTDAPTPIRKRIIAIPFTVPQNCTVTELDLYQVVLQSPKGKFRPNYFDQGGDSLETGFLPNDQEDYSDQVRRGRKRYPVRADQTCPELKDLPAKDGKPNISLASFFRPLATGVKFSGEFRFHNMRPWELGAVIWALTFGIKTTELDNSPYRHSVGQGKPLGFGSLRLSRLAFVDVTDVHLERRELNAQALSAQFEIAISSFLKSPIRETRQIKELLAMANAASVASEAWLTPPSGREAYEAIKRARLVLLPYSSMVDRAFLT